MDALKIADSAFITITGDFRSNIKEMSSDPIAGELGSAALMHWTSNADTALRDKHCLLRLLVNEEFTRGFVELVSIYTVSTKTLLMRFAVFL